jgi:hypothetical protein
MDKECEINSKLVTGILISLLFITIMLHRLSHPEKFIGYQTDEMVRDNMEALP